MISSSSTLKEDIPIQTENKQDMEMEMESIPKEENQSKPAKYQIPENPYFPLSYAGRYVTCGFCNKNITDALHFQCHECSNLFICKDCMLKRCENETHKSTHGYHVCENLKYSVILIFEIVGKSSLLLKDGMQVKNYV